MATLATMVLLIMAMRIMYKYGAFEENRGSYSHIDTLYHLREEQDRLGNANLGICILSVLGSIGSEGKSCPHKNYYKIFEPFFNSSFFPYNNLCEYKMFLCLFSQMSVLNLYVLENIIYLAIGNFERHTQIRNLYVAFKIPYAYDYINKLCKQQVEVILNHNTNVSATGQGKAMYCMYTYKSLSLAEISKGCH